jgi:hypothetical protein
MNIERFITLIEEVSLKHISVNNFGTGELWELDVNGDDIYVSVWLDQPIIINSTSEPIDEYRFRLIILDKPDVGELQESQLISKTKKIGDELIRYINKHYSSEISIAYDYTITTVTEYSDSNTCGVILEGIGRCLKETDCDLDSLFSND